MKLLILANNDGGLLSFRRELLETLVKEQHEVLFCVPAGPSVDAIRAIGCRFVPCALLERRGTNPLKDLELLRFYRKLLRSERPDAALTYTIKPNVYGGMACGALRIPYLANVTGLGTAVENGGMLARVTTALYRMGLRKAQCVFFQNEENRDFMVSRGIVKGRHVLLPGSGVNLEKYRPAEYPRGETVDFIFVARVMREKGIDQYLEAAKAIRKDHPETRFHIYGYCEQDYKGTLEAMEKEGTVIYHGAVGNMPEVYPTAACTVHPTFYPEGLSNVLLESCACARPIITTDRAGCREVVDDGVNGFVVRQRDSADLIEKLERFLALSWEQRRDMGLAGRAKVEREFDRRIVVREYLERIGGIKQC